MPVIEAIHSYSHVIVDNLLSFFLGVLSRLVTLPHS